MNQIAVKELPALATGFISVLKHAEHTPILTMIHAEIIHEAGYSAGVFDLINREGHVFVSSTSQHHDI